MDRAAGPDDASRPDDAPRDAVDDRVLLARARAGSEVDYGLLFERHRAMALRFARSKLSDPSDADDVVAEVFASVLATIKRGGGPIDVFVPYLMTSVRNQCQRVHQQHVHQLAVAVREHTATSTGRHAYVDTDAGEVDIVRDAFQSLPAKFQDVLWRVEVDEEPYDALAARYRTTPHAVATLTLRARRALASAYLDRHRPLPQPGQVTDKACRAVSSDLTGLTRGTLGSRRRLKVEAHLAQCESCRRTHAELGRINQHLRVLPIAPLALLGDAAATGTKAGIQSYLSMCWATAAPVVTSGVAAVTLVSPILLSGAQADRSIASSANETFEPADDTNPQPTDPTDPTGSSSPATTTTSATTTSSTTPATTSSSTSTTPSDPTTTIMPAATVTPVTTTRVTAAAGLPTPRPAPRPTSSTVTTPPITIAPPTVPPLTVPPRTVPPDTNPPVTLPQPPLPTAPPTTISLITAPPATAPPVQP